MGMKYMITAFNYPYSGIDVSKQTNWFIIVLFWLVALSIKYNGVTLEKRD